MPGLPKKSLLHTDGAYQFGGYSGGPTFSLPSDLAPTYLSTTQNSARGPTGSQLPIPCS